MARRPVRKRPPLGRTQCTLESLSGEPKRLSRWRFGKWHPRHLQRRQHFRQALQFLRRHAGARSTGVAQPTVFGVVAQPQGTDILSTSRGIRPSNDHELLADEAFGFDPDPAVARCVWSAGALGDDCAFSIGAGRCQALSDFSIDPVLISVAGSALLFGIGTEALP